MTAFVKGNAALCAHQEEIRYKVGRKRIKAQHLFCGFLMLQGLAAGISGYLFDN